MFCSDYISIVFSQFNGNPAKSMDYKPSGPLGSRQSTCARLHVQVKPATIKILRLSPKQDLSETHPFTEMQKACQLNEAVPG